jgi:hypothetical protein
MVAKFHYFKGRDGQFYWHLKAANGEIVANGQGYASKQGAKDGVAFVKKNAASASEQDDT